MTESRIPGTSEKPYHHGQLRQALLTAALQLAETKGLAALTLREVARQAGVSHAAPYHHFPDKSALVEALAVEGFQHLRTSLEIAAEQAAGSALDKLRDIGGTYVRFALSHQTEFRLMFRPELRENHSGPSVPSEAVGRAAQDAYQVLVDIILACQAEGFVLNGSAEPYVMTAWATMHGLATLFVDGLPGDWREPQGLEEKAEWLTQQVIAILTGGFQMSAPRIT